jgi:hypothetical protein
MNLSKITACPSQRAFHHLRQVIMREFDIPRNTIRPSVPLECLISGEQRQDFWNRFALLSGAQALPSLMYPEWLRRLRWNGVGLVFIIIAGIVLLDLRAYHFVVFALLCLVAGSFLFCSFIRSYALQFPPGYTHIRHLIRHMVATSSPSFRQQQHERSPSEIRMTIRSMVINITGVKEYNEQWDFIRDFGMG